MSRICAVLCRRRVPDYQLYCRSSDTMLGLPVNCASYATLAMLFAKRAGLTARNLIVTLGDAHIYTNHVEGVLKLLDRIPSALPRLAVSDSVVGKKIEEVALEDSLWKDIVRQPLSACRWLCKIALWAVAQVVSRLSSRVQLMTSSIHKRFHRARAAVRVPGHTSLRAYGLRGD